MAITVTPKYKPFTYDELVKPFNNYWEDYDKSEEQLDTLSNSVSTLKSVIESLPEGEEKQKYTNFLSAIGTNSDSLANSGLTASVRQALRDLKNQYAVLIPRLDAANKAYKKDLALEQSRINSGEYFVDTAHGVRQYSPVDYMDGNIPEYHAGISKKDLGVDVMNVAKSYSSRIFKGMSPEKVRRIGQTFLKLTQEQGVNADISSIAGNEQFKPILDELYKEYGVNNMNSTDQTAVKDFINRKFWEGLVYKKSEDYQQMRRAAAAASASRSRSTSITPLPVVTPNGQQLVQIGGKTMVAQGQTEDGKLIVAPVPTSSDMQRAEKKADVLNNLFIGYDNYADNNVFNPNKSKEMDEGAVDTANKVITNYVTLDAGNTDNATYTTLVDPTNMRVAYQKSIEKTLDDEDKKDIKTSNIDHTDFVGFHTGGRDESLGDNHIRLIPAQTVVETITEGQGSAIQKHKSLTDIANTYSSYEAGPKADYAATRYLKLIIDNCIEKDDTTKKYTITQEEYDGQNIKTWIYGLDDREKQKIDILYPGLLKDLNLVRKTPNIHDVQ